MQFEIEQAQAKAAQKNDKAKVGDKQEAKSANPSTNPESSNALLITSDRGLVNTTA